MAPPIVFLPNSVPCGPRRTSTRSISNKSSAAPMWRPMYTPSTYRPTPGSVVTMWSACPMPRRKMLPFSALPMPYDVNVMPGVYFPMSRRSRMFASSNVSWEKTVTEIGVSCSDSSRFRAVTVTSGRRTVSAAEPSAAAPDCAETGDGRMSALAAATTPTNRPRASRASIGKSAHRVHARMFMPRPREGPRSLARRPRIPASGMPFRTD